MNNNQHITPDILIVGAGISGIALARLLAEKDYSVLVIDKRPHIGGNCYDYKDENGIIIHKYGPHIFRTDNKEVWQFLSRFTEWQEYKHKVRAIIDSKEVPIPFNFTSIDILFDAQKAKIFEEKLISKYGENKKIPILKLKQSTDKDLQELAAFVYEKVFYHYTLKQWGLKPEELDGDALARVPVYTSYYDGYFTEKYQAIPKNGYTKMFENILKHPNIKVQLNTDFKDLKNIKYKNLFYSGPIDEYFDHKLGPLPYRSLNFEFKTLPQKQFQDVAVVNYTGQEPYTRITEFKHFLNEETSSTTIAYEYPSAFELGKNERYYPIPKQENEQLYKRYLELAGKEKNIYFIGRLGEYKYYSMHSAVAAIFELVKKFAT
ncbi:MAG: UDP-galactopyranose mutase [Elusimicrobiaceae bacterium]|nr:UDP-galactopyranose mutase [Elusimicrobiaceae bacterium]